MTQQEIDEISLAEYPVKMCCEHCDNDLNYTERVAFKKGLLTAEDIHKSTSPSDDLITEWRELMKEVNKVNIKM